VHLTNQNEIIAYILDEGHHLQEHFMWLLLEEVELNIYEV
jgi:ribosomal protein S12